jgi:hypothetical protein
MDIPSSGGPIGGDDASSQAQNQQQQTSTLGPSNGFSMVGNVFMGVSTPPRSSMM